MSRYIDRRYAAFQEYVPGEQPKGRVYIKLNANESPYPPSPAVLAAVNAKEAARLCLYSDASARALKEALAEAYGVLPENVFVSNGSDEILNFAFMAYSRPTGVAYPDISYSFYPVYARLYAADALVIPLNDDFTVPVSAFCNTGRFTVLANPNAPTGIALTPAELEPIIATNPDSVVLIDEAYVDFGAETALPLLRKYENLLVVMTYSKSRSMAGARLGFAIGSPALIADLEKIKYSTNPYNINSLTQTAALAALSEPEYYQKNCREIESTREYTAGALAAIGFTTLPSKTNFLFAKHERLSGADVYAKVKEKGILVRHFSEARIEAYNRITIGTPEQMNALIEALGQIVEECR